MSRETIRYLTVAELLSIANAVFDQLAIIIHWISAILRNVISMFPYRYNRRRAGRKVIYIIFLNFVVIISYIAI